jgi:DNA-binding NarL/FixJ family response regulator
MAARPSIPHGSIPDVCKSTSRDLILFDLMMPEMDGFAVVAALQKKAGWRDTPVIVITSLDFGSLTSGGHFWCLVFHGTRC